MALVPSKALLESTHSAVWQMKKNGRRRVESAVHGNRAIGKEKQAQNTIDIQRVACSGKSVDNIY